MPLLAALLGLATPLVRQVLIGLGFAVVSYAAFQALFTQAVEVIAGNWAGLPASVAAFLVYCGIPQGVSMLLTAYSVRLAASAAKRLAFQGSA